MRGDTAPLLKFEATLCWRNGAHKRAGIAAMTGLIRQTGACGRFEASGGINLKSSEAMTTIIAIYGALLSTLVAVQQFIQERVLVRVTVRTGTGAVPGVEAGQHVEIKSGGTIADTGQLRSMGKTAVAQTGKPLVVGATNPNVTVTKPAQQNPDYVVKKILQ
jgi:hypothetical protein